MRLRHVNALDYDRVLAVVDAWWDGRLMSTRLSHVFFSHFHIGMGFEPLHGDVVVDGVPIWFDYAGVGGHRVVFRRPLAVGSSSTAPADATGDDLDQVLVR